MEMNSWKSEKKTTEFLVSSDSKFWIILEINPSSRLIGTYFKSEEKKEEKKKEQEREREKNKKKRKVKREKEKKRKRGKIVSNIQSFSSQFHGWGNGFDKFYWPLYKLPHVGKILS